MKRIFILIGILFMGSMAFAMDVCDNEQIANTNCKVITPVIECSSYVYDLLNLTDYSTLIDDGIMTSIGSSSTYNFTFNQDSGQYLIVLCDNSTSELNVRSTQHYKLDNLLLEVDSVEENQVVISEEILSVNDTLKSINSTMGGNVWTYPTRTLTSIAWTIFTAWDTFREYVWGSILGGGQSANVTMTQINETVTWIEQYG